MSIQIAIAITEPFITAVEYAKRTGVPLGTVKNKICAGDLPIRKKKNPNGKVSRETPMINMVALTLEAAAAYKGNITINAKGE